MESSKTMKAVIVDYSVKDGGPENMSIGEAPLPVCNENEVLIKVMATAVNRADIMQRKGRYPAPKGATDVLGLECAGFIVENMETLEPSSKRVMALLPGGGYAQYAKVHKDHVIEIPDWMSFSEAASIPEVWCTAYQLLKWVGECSEGETALVHAAASGVGCAMIQLCKHLLNLQSIAVASNDEKLDHCKKLGSFASINYKNEPEFAKKVMELTENKGVNLILDPVVGGTHFHQNIASLALEARWVIFGTLGGTMIENVNMGMLLGKRASIRASTLKTRDDAYKAKLIGEVGQHCMPLFKDGRFGYNIHAELKLSQVQEAHQLIESNTTTGKVIMVNDL